MFFLKKHINVIASLMSEKTKLMFRIIRALARITTAPVTFLRKSVTGVFYKFSATIVRAISGRAPRAHIIPVMLFFMLVTIALIILLISIL